MTALGSGTRTGPAGALVLLVSLALSGCGGSEGGGGGIVSTPGPTYVKLADRTGNQSFQSGGVHWEASSAGITNQAIDAFGAGPTYAYDAASDSFTVTAGSQAITFTAADYDATRSTATSRVFVKSPTGSPYLQITTPSVGGVTFSYMEVASFFYPTTIGVRSWISVGGVPTIASDMPRSGTATYAASTGGTVISPAGRVPSTEYATANTSTATFSADFTSGAVTTSLHLVGTQVDRSLPGSPSTGSPVDFGTFTGTGTIAAGSPGFTGTFAGTTGAGFSGSFFGPKALEMGYAYNFSNGSIEAFGATVGIKQ
jgi:hypothetical protein